HLCGVDVAILISLVIPGLHLIGESFISEIAIPLEIITDVMVEGRGEGSLDARVTRIVFGALARGIGVGAFQTAVVAAERLSFRTLKVLPETGGRYAEVSFPHVFFGKAGEAGRLRGNFGAIRSRKLCAFHQRERIVARREIARG